MATYQLEEITQLLEQSRFKEALQQIEASEQNGDKLSEDGLIALKYLKSTSLLKMGRFKEGYREAEQYLEVSQEKKDHLLKMRGQITHLMLIGVFHFLRIFMHSYQSEICFSKNRNTASRQQ